MPEYLSQFLDEVTIAIPNVLIAILIFVVSLYAASLISKSLTKVLRSRKVDAEITLLLSKLTRWGIIVIGIMAALQRFFDVTAFLAGLGLVSLIIGFALQDIIQNFVAGVILLIQQPFEVGDVIETDQYLGTILAINFRTTEMKAVDGRMVTIPNASILSNPIINYTRADFRRVELPVGVSYDTDPAVARQSVLESIQNVPGYVSEPAPMVVFHTFGGSSIDLSAFFWIDTSKTNLVLATDAAFELVKAALEKKGIKLPLPVTTVYMQSEKQ